MIPVLIAGALVGLGAHACASVDNDEACEKIGVQMKLLMNLVVLRKKLKKYVKGQWMNWQKKRLGFFKEI